MRSIARNTNLPTNLQLIAIDLLIRRNQLINSPLVCPGDLPARVALAHDIFVVTVCASNGRWSRGEMGTSGRDVFVDQQHEYADN